MPKHFVIGLGEVGRAIQAIFECDGYDITMPLSELKTADVLHICFPYTPGHFAENVKGYVERTGAALVIVHSSVPVGTCDPHQWVHSPIRGVHPTLEQGIRTFTKFFGGPRANEAATFFVEKEIKAFICDTAYETEAIKLWDTTYYGWNILFEKAVKAYCEARGLDFNVVYSYANDSYNKGYRDLGRTDVQRPVLKDYPGPIGGHCVRENWELLEDPIAIISKELHKKLTGE